MSRDDNPAVNAVRRVITVYGPDPAQRTAAGLFGDLWHRVQGFFVPAVLGERGDPERSFSGYAEPLQHFHPAGGAATTTTFRDGGAADISSGVVDGPMGDPTRRIFAARLRRQQTL